MSGGYAGLGFDEETCDACGWGKPCLCEQVERTTPAPIEGLLDVIMAEVFARTTSTRAERR